MTWEEQIAKFRYLSHVQEAMSKDRQGSESVKRMPNSQFLTER